MACKDATTEIRGKKFWTQQLPVTQATPLYFRLLKVLGPGLSKVGALITDSIQSIKDKTEDGAGMPSLQSIASGDMDKESIGVLILENIQIEKVLAVLQDILNSAEEDKVWSLIEDTVRHAHCDGKKIENLDLTFESDTLMMFRCFVFVVWTNFSGFFGSSGK